MLEKTKDGTFEVSCDTCSNQEDLDTDDFHEAVELLKELGWQPYLKLQEWNHACPTCPTPEVA